VLLLQVREAEVMARQQVNDAGESFRTRVLARAAKERLQTEKQRRQSFETGLANRERRRRRALGLGLGWEKEQEPPCQRQRLWRETRQTLRLSCDLKGRRSKRRTE
jgi:hypothetical protein